MIELDSLYRYSTGYLKLHQFCYVDRNTQAGGEQNKLSPAEGIVKRMQESSEKKAEWFDKSEERTDLYLSTDITTTM